MPGSHIVRVPTSHAVSVDSSDEQRAHCRRGRQGGDDTVDAGVRRRRPAERRAALPADARLEAGRREARLEQSLKALRHRQDRSSLSGKTTPQNPYHQGNLAKWRVPSHPPATIRETTTLEPRKNNKTKEEQERTRGNEGLAPHAGFELRPPNFHLPLFRARNYFAPHGDLIAAIRPHPLHGSHGIRRNASSHPRSPAPAPSPAQIAPPRNPLTPPDLIFAVYYQLHSEELPESASIRPVDWDWGA